MFLGGRVRSPEPRAFVLRRACTPTSDGGGGQRPPVGACSRRGLGSVYVVRRACTSDGGGGQCPPVDARARRGLGSRYVFRRACTSDGAGSQGTNAPRRARASAGVSGFRAPTGVHARRSGSGRPGPGLMFPGGRVRPPGFRVFVRRRACTPDGANANASEIVS